VLEWAKAVHASDRTATVIGSHFTRLCLSALIIADVLGLITESQGVKLGSSDCSRGSVLGTLFLFLFLFFGIFCQLVLSEMLVLQNSKFQSLRVSKRTSFPEKYETRCILYAIVMFSCGELKFQKLGSRNNWSRNLILTVLSFYVTLRLNRGCSCSRADLTCLDSLLFRVDSIPGHGHSVTVQDWNCIAGG
jgi:hypothetical protein